jgi:transketolase
MAHIEHLKAISAQIKRDVIRMIHDAQSGHPGGSLGCSDFLTALFFNVMRRKPKFDMEGIGEDIFFLSNGHIAPAFYATLARAGYFDIKELATFRKLNSRLQGHPTTHDHLPGVRVASGSLGQGISVALGAALAKKQNGDDFWVYVLCGDGELEEGQNWEALMAAPNLNIQRLVLTVDWNGQQIDGPTKQVMDLGNLKAKLEAFKWQVLILEKGNDIEAITRILEDAKRIAIPGNPVAILMQTVMGKGVDFMEGRYEWHGTPPNDEQFESAMKQLPETYLGDY